MVQENKIRKGHTYYRVKPKEEETRVDLFVIDEERTILVTDTKGLQHLLHTYDYTIYDIKTNQVIEKVKKARPSSFRNYIFADKKRAIDKAISIVDKKLQVCKKQYDKTIEIMFELRRLYYLTK